MIAAGNDLDFGLDVGFMPKRLAVRQEVGNSQAVAAKRGFDGLSKVARSKRSGDLVGMEALYGWRLLHCSITFWKALSRPQSVGVWQIIVISPWMVKARNPTA